MLFVAIVLKALIEVALLALLGQGILYIFAGAGRDQNLIYRMFATVTRPAMKAARFITPRFVLDQHIGLVAFLLLALLWVATVFMKVHYFLEQGGARPG